MASRGLLTTVQLVEQSDASSELRNAVLAERRAESLELNDPLHGKIVVRDQAPLRLQFLEGCLTDMSVPDWLATLNGRVFFWLREEKLLQLLNARLYRRSAHDVLTVDTASLLRAHSARVRLSGINSGATLYPNASPRGAGTFQTVGDYNYEAAKKRRGWRDAVVELAVVDGVVDIMDHVIKVERRQANDVVSVLFER